MTRNRVYLCGLRALAICLSCLIVTVVGGADSLVILQPGYPGSTKDAREFVKDLCATVTELGGPKLSSGEYHNDESQGLEAIEKGSSVGIVSLGIYLKHRKSLKLRPLFVSSPKGQCRLMVKEGTFSDVTELAGKKVLSTAFAEPEFVDRVILGHAKTKPPGSLSAAWHTSRAKSFSRGLRNLKKGRCGAVLLSAREYEGYEKRLKKPGDGLAALHTSRSFPAAVVVVFGDALPEEQIGGLERAVEALPRNERGQKLLERMGIRNFVAVDSKSLTPFEELFQRNCPSDSDVGTQKDAK